MLDAGLVILKWPPVFFFLKVIDIKKNVFLQDLCLLR